MGCHLCDKIAAKQEELDRRDQKNQKGKMLTCRGAQEHASSVLSITTSISLNPSKTLNSPRLASVFFSFSSFRSVAFSSSPSYHRFGRSFFLSRPSCPCMLLSSSDKSHRFSQFSTAASTASREQLVEEDEKIGTEEKLDFESESGIEGFEFDGNAVMNELKCLSSPSFEVKELEELPEQWRRAKLAWLCKELPSHNAGTLNRILNAQRKWITREDATYIAVHCMRIRENETGFRVYKWMMQQHWFRFDFALATKLADYMGKERKFSKCREIFEDIIKQGRVPSESTFHILTIAYLSAPIQGCLEEACSVYNRMIQLGGYRPRLSLHNSLFRAVVSKPGGSSKSYLKQAEFIFHNMVTSGFDVHKDVYAGLIWLHSYQETIDRERMTALRAEMRQARIEEGKDVLVSILRACSKEGDVEEAERTWLKLLQFDDGLPSQAFVYRMEVYAKVGEPMKSLEIFRVMQEHLGSASVVAYHKIIEVLSKAQEIELAETLMTEFINSALKPLMPSFIDLMTMYFKLDLHDKLESAFSQCLEKCHPNRTIYNIYLESLVKMGNLDKAEHIFNQMHNNGAIGVNARSCNNILRGYLFSGENVKAAKIYDLMCQKKYDIESPLMEKLDYVLSMNKKAIKKPRSPKLNEIQREILVGLLLGGLQIESDEMRRNHMVHFEFNENSSIHCVLRSHIYDQYHEWLNSHSKPIDGTDEVPQRFSTIAHSCFGYYADQFWPKGQPSIPKLIHRWLSPCVMAYWYMYGGRRTSSGDIVLKLMGSREDVERVVKALKVKSLDCRVKRKGRVFWIGFLGSNSKWFWKLTEPYILEDLKHLLKAGDQTSEDCMADNGNSSFNSESDSDEKTSQHSDNSNP